MNFELWLTRKVGHMYKLAIRALHGMVKGKALFYIERTAREISGRVQNRESRDGRAEIE